MLCSAAAAARVKFPFQEFVQAEVDKEAAAFAEEKERAKKTAEERSQGVDERLKRLKRAAADAARGHDAGTGTFV